MTTVIDSTATDRDPEPLGDIDPISFEVIRNKLSAITEEQSITLRAVSGSPVVTDATDFNVGTYLNDGQIVTMGPQILFHSGSMASVVRNLIADCEDDPGINDGDMFILNDPYKGALHQPDVTVIAPVFYKGERVAFVGCCAHQIDIGGMNFGSWSFKARGIQEEAMLLPGVKLVEGGLLRKDLWAMIMGMTRMPTTVGLDLKAMIAANNVAIRRLVELCDRYGLDTVLSVMHHEIRNSEVAVREALRELPDGIFRAVDYLDHDGHENKVYEFRLTLTKRGDHLDFDFTGTDPQAPGFINCTKSGLIAGVYTAMLPTLAPHVRWNEGILRAVTIKAPEGIVANAKWPAPVSGASVSGTWLVCNVAFQALSRLVTTNPSTSRYGAAVTKGHMSIMVISGTDRDGLPYGNFLLDSTAGGGGAYSDHDGLTGSGDFCAPRPTITNVETHEANGPILFLYRSILPDSSGAGRQRGGSGVGLAITPHDTDALTAMMVGHGIEVPNSAGIFGGLEGACGINELLTSAERVSPVGLISSHADHAAWPGERVNVGAKPGFVPLTTGDVISYTFQGGGGYGDPVERDPGAVADDIELGYVSREIAENVYGVVVDADGAVDAVETERRRHIIRAERIGTADVAVGNSPVAGRRLTPRLTLTDQGAIVDACGHSFGVGPDWKSGAVRRIAEPRSHGRHVVVHEDLEIREYICPSCATLLESNVLRIGAADIVTTELL